MRFRSPTEYLPVGPQRSAQLWFRPTGFAPPDRFQVFRLMVDLALSVRLRKEGVDRVQIAGVPRP